MKKRLDLCLGVEGWSTGFEVVECETEWCDIPPHSNKVSLSSSIGNHS